MPAVDPLRGPAADLLEAAHAFHRAAEIRGSHAAAPESLASLQEALQVLSSAWYRLAADAALSPRRGGLSREQEVRLIGAFHDIAATFARSARTARGARAEITPIIAASRADRVTARASTPRRAEPVRR